MYCAIDQNVLMIKRCPRNCFNCPICTAPLSINSLNPDPNTRSITGPFTLNCGYCSWSSLNIGWQFEKLSNIQAQIARLNLSEGHAAPSTPRSPETSGTDETTPNEGLGAAFKRLSDFYRSQLSKSNTADPLLTPSGLNYSSPSNLMRIMSLYNNGKGGQGKKGSWKSEIMREGKDMSEGLQVIQPDQDVQAIERMRTEGWACTLSQSQRSMQKHSLRFTSELRPIPDLLRTKRNKRCRTCRHILVKPEPKVQTTRFRIRLLAINYIPTISVVPLQPAPSTHIPAINQDSLPALKACQFLLTLKNPLFESVKVTLATPPRTPGRYGHKVTILCPEMNIGPNVDKWDEALGDAKTRRTSRILPGFANKPEYVGGEGGKVAEAGKVWEKGRNWTSVVVEVVCALAGNDDIPPAENSGGRESDDFEQEDEDVVEIPIFVRMEWEGDMAAGDGAATIKGDVKEKRELAFWTVVGIGRVSRP